MYNRTVTFNTNSEDITKATSSLLFYLNVAKDRILADSEYPSTNEIIMPFDEARALLAAMYSLLTLPGSDAIPEDGQFSLEEFYRNTKGIVIPSPE